MTITFPGGNYPRPGTIYRFGEQSHIWNGSEWLPLPERAAGKHEDPKGGLNAAGRKHFGVKKGVTNYSGASEEDKKRWVRWALRFTKNPKPLKKDGKPTRYALMFHAWGEPVPSTPEAVRAVHRKAETRAKQLKMGEHAEAQSRSWTQAYDEEWLHSSDNHFWEDVVKLDDEQSEQEHTGVMVAFYPSAQQALDLAVPGGEHPDDLHVTLAYLGQVGAELTPEDEPKVIDAVRAWAATQTPITGQINGLGVFDQDPPVTYANVDAALLPAARQRLVETLENAGVRHAQEHGYTPHMTLVYEDAREHTPPRSALNFAQVHVVFAGRRTAIPLGPEPLQVNEPAQEAAEVATENPMQTEDARAFSVEINGRQFIAGPAHALGRRLESAGMREPSIEEITEAPMLYLHGRFVGANEANRNGAYWSAGDLQLSSKQVAHGPLNWLHEGRHVIGAITDANYIETISQVADAAAPAGTRKHVQPHIAASAAVWRWLYPDEAFVVQQASELGQLWYSMECISKSVSCIGENGCGASSPYSDYIAGASCEHVRNRASVRQFNNPVFLGGAVIVPPARPGWADADASVMHNAERLAEAAFEQSYADKPGADVKVSDWENLMAQLIAYASS